MCDEVGFIPDYKIPQMWVHWDLKPCCVLIVSVALAVSTPISLQTYGDLCECDITYFTLISLYRLILFSWAPLDKARFSSFLQYFCCSQSKHGNLIIPEGQWKQASIDILVSKTKDRRKTRSERSWRSARVRPDGRQLWACAGLSSCPAGTYRCIYCIKHRFLMVWIITYTEEWPLDGLCYEIEWRLRQNSAPTLIAGYGFLSIHNAVSALYLRELSSHSGIRRIAMG